MNKPRSINHDAQARLTKAYRKVERIGRAAFVALEKYGAINTDDGRPEALCETKGVVIAATSWTYSCPSFSNGQLVIGDSSYEESGIHCDLVIYDRGLLALEAEFDESGLVTVLTFERGRWERRVLELDPARGRANV